MAEAPGAADASTAKGTPTVIVSHLDVKFSVYGGGRRGVPSAQGSDVSLLDRIRGRSAPKVREIHAVKDVSFVAYHGESIGIIGRNGSGKSTLLRAVAGLIPPSGGRLWVAGEPSLLGVNAVLMNKLSGERNIHIGAQALGLSKTEIAERFDDIVDFSGIGDAVYLPMSTYSSGMGARLRFAISTAAAPDVLMIDEALATGDADFREKSKKRISEIREQAGTVFLVSHSNSNIREICDRVLWMDAGRLLMDGPTEEVVRAYEETLPKKSRRPSATTEPPVPGTTRWARGNRYQVSGQICRKTWRPGVEGCFVVSVHHLAAARVITPVAVRLGWPILWVRPGAVPSITRDEINRLRPSRIIVVGDDEAINRATYERIAEMDEDAVERMGVEYGESTPLDVLEAFPPGDTSTVHVTPVHPSGRAVALSLVAAAAGQAVVVSDTKLPSAELADSLSRIGPTRLLFCGDEEDWSVEVVDSLREATGAQIEFDSRGGPMSLAAGLWDAVAPGGTVMVTGRSSVEVLSATVSAVHQGVPLLLLPSDRIPAMVHRTIKRLAPDHVVLAATSDAIPHQIRAELGQIVEEAHGVEEATSEQSVAGD